MKRRLLIAALSLLSITPQAGASAEDCMERACIDVYTQDGHIVIEGRKGKGASSRKVVTPPAKSAIPKPRVTKSATPKPSPKGSIPPPIKKVIPKPAVPKPVVKKPVVTSAPEAATSIEDKLIESLPTAGISYQPSFSPLVKTPVYLWSDIPTLITKKIEIVGEFVEVRLRPTFIWHYGDGTIYVTRKVGGPFPEGEIRHSYAKPGHYLIELITRWDGEFTIDGVSARIPGEITTVSILPITIVAAPIRFMN